MRRSDFKISIPQPCHEDWDKMQPDARGKFCSACCESVHDFSDKTPDEIRDFFRQHASEKICGYFIVTQINKPLLKKTAQVRTTAMAKFALAVYLVFGSLLFSCKTLPEPEQESISPEDWQHYLFTKGKTRVVRTESDSARSIYGRADYMLYLTEEVTDTTLRMPE